MNRKLVALVLSLTLLISFACKQKEQQPIPQVPVPPPGMGAPMPPGMGAPGGIMMPKGELQIVVPPAVKGKWSAVIIRVEDKTSRKMQEFTVKLNSELQVPNSNLKVAVGEFIPDFRMDVGTITSASNDLNNPAVGVKVFEGGKQVFPEPGKGWGWLYSKFPAIHPFEHPKFSVTLKEGLKKG